MTEKLGWIAAVFLAMCFFLYVEHSKHENSVMQDEVTSLKADIAIQSAASEGAGKTVQYEMSALTSANAAIIRAEFKIVELNNEVGILSDALKFHDECLDRKIGKVNNNDDVTKEIKLTQDCDRRAKIVSQELYKLGDTLGVQERQKMRDNDKANSDSGKYIYGNGTLGPCSN